MKYFDEISILNVMRGATLLASGGGGSLKDGLIMLAAYKKAHPDNEIKVAVCTADEMSADGNAVVVAVMGAPSGGANQDITPCVLNAYDEITNIATAQGANIKYTLPIEMGGFNTFVPMLISMTNETPIIDADACGRAVPSLDTALSHINGCKTSPVALADIKNDRAVITTDDPYDAALVQKMASPIVEIFEQNAGIAGWMLQRPEIKNCIPNGTLTTAYNIGSVLEEVSAAKDADIFYLIKAAGFCEAETLMDNANIYDFQTGLKNGWDVGGYYVGYDISDRTGMYHILFSNESLLIYRVFAGGEERLIMTAPDIIALYDSTSYQPLTNEDLQLYQEAGRLGDLKVTLGVIKVDEKWWLYPEKANASWKKYFAPLGYDGDIVRYPFK